MDQKTPPTRLDRLIAIVMLFFALVFLVIIPFTIGSEPTIGTVPNLAFSIAVVIGFIIARFGRAMLIWDTKRLDKEQGHWKKQIETLEKRASREKQRHEQYLERQKQLLEKEKQQY